MPKISELEAVNQLFDGCCIPIVQNGETKKVTFAVLKEILEEELSIDVSWGEIIGTLASQTDLQNALNEKGTYSKPSGGIPASDLEQTYALSSALTSHTGNTSNPHNVTKAQVGLGKVIDNAISFNSGSYDTSRTIDYIVVDDGTLAKRYEIPQGTYSKPSGGIPKSDLASGVQASLNKADSALQDEDTEEVTTIGIDSTVTSGSNNLIISGAVYTVVGDVETALQNINTAIGGLL